MKKYKSLIVLLPILLLAQSCNLLGPFGGGGGNQGIAGGILKSADSGENWEPSNKLVSEGQLSGVSVSRVRIDPANSEILYFSSPTSGVFTSSDKGDTWKNILSGSQMYDMQVNPRTSEELIAGGASQQIAKVFKSADKGQTWVEVYSEAKKQTFVSALAYLPNNPQTIFIGLSTGEIIRSNNGGTSWNLLSKLEGRIVRIEFPAGNLSLIKALTAATGLYVSENGGSTFNSITQELRIYGLQDFSSVPGNTAATYVATSDGLHRTTNNGSTWEKMRMPVHEGTNTVTTVLVNKKNSNQVFAVIAQTLYKSSDAGASWQTKVLPASGTVRDLLINPDEPNIMYAAIGQPLK